MQTNQELYNIALEKTVLASIIFEPESFEDVSIALNSDDFYLPAHQDIYTAILNLTNKNLPIDEEFIKKELLRVGRFDEQVMLDILSANPSSNIDAYIDEIVEKSSLRKLLDISIGFRKEILEENASSGEATTNLLQKIEAIENGNIKGFTSITLDTAIKEFEAMPNKPKYETGISLIDNFFNGGLELNQLIMLGGAKGAGKTAFSMQFLFNVSKGFKSAFLSFEMPTWKIASRAKKANLSNIQKNNISILDKGRDIREIEQTIKSLYKRGVKFFTIDSLMKITNRHHKGKRHEQIADITARLSKLCVEFEIIIILIVQVSNEDLKSGHMAVKGSGDADYDADIMFFIQKDKDNEHKRYFICEKNRQNGNEFKQEVYFNPKNISLQAIKPALYEVEYTTSKNDDMSVSMGVI